MLSTQQQIVPFKQTLLEQLRENFVQSVGKSSIQIMDFGKDVLKDNFRFLNKQFEFFTNLQVNSANPDILEKYAHIKTLDQIWRTKLVNFQENRQSLIIPIDFSSTVSTKYAFLSQQLPLQYDRPTEYTYRLINVFMDIFGTEWVEFAEVLAQLYMNVNCAKAAHLLTACVSFFAMRHLPTLITFMTQFGKSIPKILLLDNFALYKNTVHNFFRSLIVLGGSQQVIQTAKLVSDRVVRTLVPHKLTFL